MNRLLSLVLCLTFLISAVPAAPVSAQDAAVGEAQQEAVAVPALAVARNEAVADYPEGITFTFEAETDDPISELELVFRSPGVDTYSVELPDFEVGTTSLALDHLVDLRGGLLPPGVDVHYHWRITEEDGDVIESSEQTLLWEDDRYDWTPLSGPHVTVYSYDGDAAFQQQILDTAERTVDSLAEAYGAELDQPIRIWVYTGREDFYGALAPNSEPGIAGAARPDLHLIHAVVPTGNYREMVRVVPHEVLHQVLHQVTEGPFTRVPLWLNEGLAQYWQESGRDAFYTLALQRAATGDLPPLRSLNGDFAYETDEARVAYGLSLSVVLYILDTWGDEGMANLIAAFPEGVTYDEAVQKGLGISFDELDRGWREHLMAEAERLGVTGSTRFDDGGGDFGAPWSSLWEEIAVASGTVILGLVLLIALVAGVIRARRSSREEDEVEVETAGLRWREWPEIALTPLPATPSAGTRPAEPGEGGTRASY
jgi:hypothetical protein